jgi:hypothetical protein
MPKLTQQFQTIRTEGALLPPDILQRIASLKVDGVRPADYHLPEGFRINDAITRSWDILKKHWKSFQEARQRLAASDHGTSITNERWLLPLFKELEYGRLSTSPSPQIEDRSYPIERFYNHTPIHLIGCNLPMDRRTNGARGAATSSPHSIMQEFLNRSEQHQWGFLSNGLQLRILRDNVALSRQAYVEFDLEGMMEGEVYGDFVLLWLLCHQSRVEAERIEDCWLEKWSKLAREEGTRVLNNLRTGVTRAIELLGQGFIAHPHNDELRSKLQESGTLTKDDFYRQLLRIVYRLLFLFVAEDRKLLHPPDADEPACELYDQCYSTRRLREMAFKLRGSKHADLWHSLSLVFEGLHRNNGLPELGLPALGSFLWNPKMTANLIGPSQIPAAVPSPPDKGERARVRGLSSSEESTGTCHPVFISNDDLLAAIRTLAYVEQDKVLRSVDYRNLGTEEFGSVYESLLELHPTVHVEAKSFDLGTAAGNERKTSGSYYTPDSLVQCLLDSALDPVVEGRLKGKKGKDAEAAILGIKVCDPACGSGHFLIAAAHRLARHLARIRTGESEPGPEEYQHALRDVISRCIYGVDVNPMAVELCKVSLWMESLDPGRPLSFLDHHIKVGNSLLGVTPRLLEDGIPNEAFEPIEGDVTAVCRDFKNQNRDERKGRQQGQTQKSLFDQREPYIKLGNLPGEFSRLSSAEDVTVADVAEKERRYGELVNCASYVNARLLADTWCAVFVWQKDTSDLGKLCPTERDFRNIENNPHSILPHVKSEILRLACQYQFFHWHLAFPDVFRLPGDAKPENEQTGWNAGFDVVLGNPPWNQIQHDPKEFFATSAPAIVNAPHMTARKKAIAALETSDPPLFHKYKASLREVEGIQATIHASGRFSLTSYGRLNTASLFCELVRSLISRKGRVGQITPSGIATDSFNQHFFQDLIDSQSLASLFSFLEIRKLFLDTDSRNPFCLLTLSAPSASPDAELAFGLLDVSSIADPQRRFRLSSQEMALLNPNTRTCPVFRSRTDAELTLAIYRQNQVLALEGNDNEEGAWGFHSLIMFMMNTSSEVFRTDQSSDADVPLLEGKLIHQFNHRFTASSDSPNSIADPDFAVPVRYWLPKHEVDDRVGERWSHSWFMGWRSISRADDERTMISTIVPRVGMSNTLLTAFVAQDLAEIGPCLVSTLNSFALDYVLRQKIAGTDVRLHLVKQLPVIEPATFRTAITWESHSPPLSRWLLSRVLELTYTAWDLEAFALDCGYSGPPFRWDEERRFLLRCELDAAYFHLYLGPPAEWGTDSPQLREMFPTPRDAVDYIMETFPIVKRKDIKRTTITDESGHVTQPGTYITKDAILSIYDEMQTAIDTGQPYQTRLAPPPGPPADSEGKFLPSTEWDGSDWPPHIHLLREGEAGETS